MYLDKLTGEWLSSSRCCLSVTVPTAVMAGTSLISGSMASSAASSAARTQASAATSAAQTQADAATRSAQIQADAQREAATTQAGAAERAATTQAEAALKASTQQQEAALAAGQVGQAAGNEARDRQLSTFDTNTAGLKPYIQAGIGGLDTAKNLLGLDASGMMPAGGPDMARINATLAQTPGYAFTLDQGLKATQNSYAAQGLGSSGAALKGAATFATGLASQTYEQQLQNYLNLAATGQSASQTLAQLGVQNTQAAGEFGLAGGLAEAQALGSAGAASAAGTLGAGQATAAGTLGSAQANALGILGSSSATASGITGAAGATAAGTVGAANATAQGKIASTNALTQGITGVGNAVVQGTLLSNLNGSGGLFGNSAKTNELSDFANDTQAGFNAGIAGTTLAPNVYPTAKPFSNSLSLS